MDSGLRQNTKLLNNLRIIVTPQHLQNAKSDGLSYGLR